MKESELIPIRQAAEIIGCDFVMLMNIIDVGDLKPTGMPPEMLGRPLLWGDVFRKIEFSAADIERFKIEMRRRHFVNFKTEYIDVYQEDTGPGARSLEFGPGWEGILRRFCDGLREIQAAGSHARLRWGKEKFGALRLFNDVDEDVAEAVGRLRGEAYRASLQTCQECGEPARLRFGHSICLTLCEKHRHLVGDPDPERDGIILDVEAWSRANREEQ